MDVDGVDLENDYNNDFEGEEDHAEEEGGDDEENSQDGDDIPIIQWRMKGKTVDELRIGKERTRLN